MGVLVCRPGGGVQIAAEGGQQPETLACPYLWPCVPCASPSMVAFCCQQSRECVCMDRGGWRLCCRMPCVPGVCSMCFSACGQYLYQLSSEADTVHTRCTITGELLYAAPAGVFPRCMKMHASGRLLLCAGGAVGEAALLNAPDLTTIRTIETRHPCFAADFCRDGLVLVCAAEGHDIQTAVYVSSARSENPCEIIRLPGAPCGLCVCPDGMHALISTWNGLMKVNLHSGAVLWNRAEWAYCMRIECRGQQMLISDTMDGGVWLINHCRPSEKSLLDNHPESQACFI